MEYKCDFRHGHNPRGLCLDGLTDAADRDLDLAQCFARGRSTARHLPKAFANPAGGIIYTDLGSDDIVELDVDMFLHGRAGSGGSADLDGRRPWPRKAGN